MIDAQEKIKLVIDKSFDRIIQELFPLGTRNAAMRKKDKAVEIIMEELNKICG